MDHLHFFHHVVTSTFLLKACGRNGSLVVWPCVAIAMAERYAFIQDRMGRVVASSQEQPGVVVNAPEGAALPELDEDGNREQTGGGDLCSFSGHALVDNMTLHLQRESNQKTLSLENHGSFNRQLGRDKPRMLK
eukprot:Skav221985  [mRNA]  locus=scaffold195:1169512:1171181:- [translate_table: standard]